MLTVADSVAIFLDSRVGLVTAKTARINKHYLKSLEHVFHDRDIASITLADLRDWRKMLVERPMKYGGQGRRKLVQEHLSPHTVHGHVRNCKQLFRWLFEEGYIPANPAARLKQVPITHETSNRTMTDADFQKMLDASMGESPECVRDRALLWFFASTGCRLGGAAKLKMEHLELSCARAIVTEKGKGGGKTRTVYLKSEAIRAMHEWLLVRAQLQPTTDHAFTTVPNMAGQGGGTALCEKTIYAQFRRIAKRARVTGRFNPHALRHRLAKRMLRRGANLSAVSKVLGHSGIRVTHEFYGIYEDGEARDAHLRYA